VRHPARADIATSCVLNLNNCAAFQVVDAPEVLTVIDKLPGAKRMLNALYYCEYQEFFPGFLHVVGQLEHDFLLADHVRFFMREARVVVYSQYLASYKSVTIVAMAAALGVSPGFLDSEVSARLLHK
jgi:26S proteasome regulatory subunit N7